MRDVIAIKNKKNIFAIGDKAYEMYEKLLRYRSCLSDEKRCDRPF